MYRILVALIPCLLITLACSERSSSEWQESVAFSQESIDAGKVPLAEIVARGRELWFRRFDRQDGYGDRRNNADDSAAPFVHVDRLVGPDSSSCQDCHGAGNLILAGPGDGAANAFVAFNEEDPRDIIRANQRNTPGLQGRSWMELLADEITADLHELRAEAVADVEKSGEPREIALTSKGITFGRLVVSPAKDGDTPEIDTSGVTGVSSDLKIRPFSRKGTAPTLKVFTAEALNRHHGMQSGAFIASRGGDPASDFDGDGVANEVPDGDLTALTLFQALLPVPVRIAPEAPFAARQAEAGEELFSQVGCAECHVPSLRVADPTFRLPSPLDPTKAVAVDLTRDAEAPRLAKEADGSVRVPLYSDLRRHDLGELRHEPNPQVIEDNQALSVPRELLLTPPLWGVASSGPWLHDGRATSLDDAIRAHGGDASASRTQYLALKRSQRHAIVAFLSTLRLEGDNGPLRAKPRVSQDEIDAGRMDLETIAKLGEQLWFHQWTREEGFGDNDDTSVATADNQPPFSGFNRVRGPDANNCQSCHGGGTLLVGGPGGNAMNATVNINDVETLEVIDADMRNTPPIHGIAWLEVLGDEMTAELQGQRERGLEEAKKSGEVTEVSLQSKGVFFGRLRFTPRPDGEVDVDETGLEGITRELLVRPYHAKGTLRTIRSFTYISMFRHTGVESNEFVQDNVMTAADAHFDRDEDGVIDEATFGDITALTVFQARFPVPVQIWPEDPAERARAEEGERLFSEIGCADCHRPTLVVDEPVLAVPSPIDPRAAVKLRLTTEDVLEPRLTARPDGKVEVPLYGDLKLHDLGKHFEDTYPQKLPFPHAPEPLVERHLFMTTELWGVADTGPWLHNGRATTLDEAIRAHGGEALPTTRAYRSLPTEKQAALLAFLHTLKLTPDRHALGETPRR